MINIAIYVLLVFEVIVCFLLLAVILVQRSKSQGAGMAFGAGMGETMFGSQVGNVLTRSTVILGIAFLVITTALAYLTPRAGTRGATDLAPDVEPIVEQPQVPQVPTGTAPGPGASSFPSTPLAPLGEGDLDSSGITPPAVAPLESGQPPVAAVPPADIQPVEIPAGAPAAPIQPQPAPVIPAAPAAEVPAAPAAPAAPAGN